MEQSTQGIADRSGNIIFPQITARLAGAFYLLMGLCAAIAQIARQGLIVKGDAATTVSNILAHKQQFLLGFAGDVLVPASFVVVTVLLYQLLKPVNSTAALLAAWFSLAACVIQAFGCTFMLAPFVLLDDVPSMNVFTTAQLQALAYVFLKLYTQAYGVALVFFGFAAVLNGYLVYRSTFLPRFTGVLLLIAGAAWLCFLAPFFGVARLGYLMPFAAGEVVLYLWLLLAGVNVPKWHEQVRRATP